MDESDDVISIWKNVSIEINANNLSSGVLKMVRRGNSIVFHWIPYNFQISDFFDINPGNISFTIDLYNVISISFDTSHLEHGIIEFLFKNFTVFPRFFFINHGKFAVSHLIQYLLNQKIAVICPNNESMISISPNISEMQYLPENTINSSNFKTLVDHWKVLDELGIHEPNQQKIPISGKNTISDKTNEDPYHLKLKNLCFDNGISNQDRCKLWTLFLNNGIKYHMEDPRNLTRRQNEEISTKINLIYKDTKDLIKLEKRNDSYLLFLRDIMCSYSIFYPNSTFQSGLCEILSIFIDVFVKSIQDSQSTVIMNDNRVFEYNEARYYIFCLFISFINKNGNLQSQKHYRSFIDRINAIIESVDPSVSSLLSFYQMSQNLDFLSQSIYLLYTHDFDREKLLRLWDSIVTFSDEKGTLFILFFHAAMAILLFNPIFMSVKKVSIDILQVADEAKKKANLDVLIKMAVKLMDIVKTKKKLEWIFQPLDEENDFLDYKPNYLTIVSS